MSFLFLKATRNLLQSVWIKFFLILSPQSKPFTHNPPFRSLVRFGELSGRPVDANFLTPMLSFSLWVTAFLWKRLFFDFFDPSRSEFSTPPLSAFPSSCWCFSPLTCVAVCQAPLPSLHFLWVLFLRELLSISHLDQQLYGNSSHRCGSTLSPAFAPSFSPWNQKLLSLSSWCQTI